MSMALLHGSLIHYVFLGQIILNWLPAATYRKAVTVDIKIKTSQIPSERTAKGQRDECHQQEVSDSVEVKWRKGHHGNGQGQREAGSQRQEFAERDQGEVGCITAAWWQISGGRCVSSYLLLSFKVLQLISSMYTTTRGTVCGQQGSGSNWAECLQRVTSYTHFLVAPLLSHLTKTQILN